LLFKDFALGVSILDKLWTGFMAIINGIWSLYAQGITTSGSEYQESAKTFCGQAWAQMARGTAENQYF